ncbi:hypothetical protein CRENPOLYSF1_430080 [Crenothrix polyspora]|uniref:Uncharacterized protein n=1 Tax=Crenothrix polyspora TaxID=360316 RepID=A0A1R4HBZ1_9GAMM|nr:hypothetical protein CRENPOLYSF1_430080 [Crenothrix polyspora]
MGYSLDDKVAALPEHHKDPQDHIIIAPALNHNVY